MYCLPTAGRSPTPPRGSNSRSAIKNHYSPRSPAGLSARPDAFCLATHVQICLSQCGSAVHGKEKQPGVNLYLPVRGGSVNARTKRREKRTKLLLSAFGNIYPPFIVTPLSRNLKNIPMIRTDAPLSETTP